MPMSLMCKVCSAVKVCAPSDSTVPGSVITITLVPVATAVPMGVVPPSTNRLTVSPANTPETRNGIWLLAPMDPEKLGIRSVTVVGATGLTSIGTSWVSGLPKLTWPLEFVVTSLLESTATSSSDTPPEPLGAVSVNPPVELEKLLTDR